MLRYQFDPKLLLLGNNLIMDANLIESSSMYISKEKDSGEDFSCINPCLFYLASDKGASVANSRVHEEVLINGPLVSPGTSKIGSFNWWCPLGILVTTIILGRRWKIHTIVSIQKGSVID